MVLNDLNKCRVVLRHILFYKVSGETKIIIVLTGIEDDFIFEYKTKADRDRDLEVIDNYFRRELC